MVLQADEELSIVLNSLLEIHKLTRIFRSDAGQRKGRLLNRGFASRHEQQARRREDQQQRR